MIETNCADEEEVTTPHSPQDTDKPETDGNDIYSEMVLRSYDDLFEPWLKPDPDPREEGSGGSKP